MKNFLRPIYPLGWEIPRPAHSNGNLFSRCCGIPSCDKLMMKNEASIRLVAMAFIGGIWMRISALKVLNMRMPNRVACNVSSSPTKK